MVSLLMLALAVSLDGFGAGLTYGMRRIRIPFSSLAIVGLCSGLVIWISMQLGAMLAPWLHPQAAKAAGAAILIAIGAWALLQMVRQTDKDGEANAVPVPIAQAKQLRTIVRIEIRRLGLVIDVLKTPSKADVDRSGTISAGEAALLGAALSLDAFGAGLGAALLGFPPASTAVLIALSCSLFIGLGTAAGCRLSGMKWIRPLSFLPGWILIAMGLFKLL